MSGCHPSSLFLVIPVPRHWDPGNLIASNALGLVSMGFAL
ncbi:MULTISPECIES: WPE palindromic element domain-containing protein [unclassified Wolbachia]|nr:MULTISPECIES: WPE palindromic element domain-containing protein [unclassified Wolbachia]WMT84638.1 WPE palindromic element domain-containing protein [Wolbachia endosymbiont of Listronotus oregonensis]